MKKVIGILILALSLFGCSESDTKATADKNFVGTWVQVNTGSAPAMKATISKAGDDYVVEVKLAVPNQAPVVVTKPAKLKEGVLVADQMEKISFVASTGHLKIGANEFELVK